MEYSNSKMDLCSSTCCCLLLRQMHDNFVRKFKVYPNGGSLESSPTANEVEISPKVVNDSIIPPSGVLQEAIESGEPMEYFFGEESNDVAECATATVTTNTNKIVIGEGGINFEIVDEDSRTPMPFYEMMSELELNAELAKYGHGPMGKRTAIRLLNQIFDATHPVLSTTTPIPRKITRILAPSFKKDSSNDQARQKRAKTKIAQLMGKEQQKKNGNEVNLNDKGANGIEVDQEIMCLINEKENDDQEQKQTEKIKIVSAADLTRIFLCWLRKPGNEQQYNNLLLLNPIFFDKLYAQFKHDTKSDVRISKETFMEMLDKLGITYCCSRNDPMENQ